MQYPGPLLHDLGVSYPMIIESRGTITEFEPHNPTIPVIYSAVWYWCLLNRYILRRHLTTYQHTGHFGVDIFR